MIGAIIGDIAGSRFERQAIKSKGYAPQKDFDFFTEQCKFTDDTVLTLAIANSILKNTDYAKSVKEYGLAYFEVGYGHRFKTWLKTDTYEPYNSWGNGSAMRVSAVAYAFNTLDEVLAEAKRTAEITHNHPEGIKGAQATALAIFLARTGKSKREIKYSIESRFEYDLDRKISEIAKTYVFDVSCQGSVPEAIIAFLEAEDFEDTIRTAISIGGDTDTIACIAGSIAEAFYKEIPTWMVTQAKERLDDNLLKVLEDFQKQFILEEKDSSNPVLDAIIGVATADALGVPYEFLSRAAMDANPATEMRGYGTYNLPPGTWSDDSSLTFCLAESLTKGYDLEDIARKFIAWKNENYWTPRGEVFDIGNTTAVAINRLNHILSSKKDLLIFERYLGEEHENGNGSLMRIMPLLFFIKGKPIEEQFKIVWEVSALTHRHIRAAMACMIYLKIAEFLLDGHAKETALSNTKKDMLELWKAISFADKERELFKNVIVLDLLKLERDKIKSSGYVIDSLEAALWAFYTTDSYKSAVLKAVNLGRDTDTVAAIAGGLAGLCYGIDNIPQDWIGQLARKSDIIDLCHDLNQAF